jgi:hypothetical protein
VKDASECLKKHLTKYETEEYLFFTTHFPEANFPRRQYTTGRRAAPARVFVNSPAPRLESKEIPV